MTSNYSSITSQNLDQIDNERTFGREITNFSQFENYGINNVKRKFSHFKDGDEKQYRA